jgi:hypothetical protein
MAAKRGLNKWLRRSSVPSSWQKPYRYLGSKMLGLLVQEKEFSPGDLC